MQTNGLEGDSSRDGGWVSCGPSNQIDHHDGTLAFDMDRDDDLDMISIGWYNPKLWIFENLGSD